MTEMTTQKETVLGIHHQSNGRQAGQKPVSLQHRLQVQHQQYQEPHLNDAWSRAIRKCKTELTLFLIEDLQRTYNKTKAAIAKDLTELENQLSPNQTQEIKDSLSTKFKQMTPVFMEKKQNQFKGPKPPAKRRQAKATQRQAPAAPPEHRYTYRLSTPYQNYFKAPC